MYAVAATYSDRREISLAKRKFRLRTENFACETILFRQAPRKLLKSLGREISDFAVSCDFKGLRPILFRAFFAVRFPIRPSGLAQFSFSEFIDSTNSIPGKGKKLVPEFAHLRGSTNIVRLAARHASVKPCASGSRSSTKIVL